MKTLQEGSNTEVEMKTTNFQKQTGHIFVFICSTMNIDLDK